MIAICVVTNGRWSYLERCMESISLCLPYFGRFVLVDDSGQGITSNLLDNYKPDVVVTHRWNQGLSAAVNSAWNACRAADYVFHLEEDFVFPGEPPFGDMVDLLDQHPRLSQVVLKRNAALTPEEQMAGGFMECNPNAYTQRDGFVEHSECFSLNPCVIPGAIIRDGWPAGNEAEQTQRHRARGRSFAIYGDRFDLPRAIHIGDVRAPAWKL